MRMAISPRLATRTLLNTAAPRSETAALAISASTSSSVRAVERTAPVQVMSPTVR